MCYLGQVGNFGEHRSDIPLRLHRSLNSHYLSIGHFMLSWPHLHWSLSYQRRLCFRESLQGKDLWWTQWKMLILLRGENLRATQSLVWCSQGRHLFQPCHCWEVWCRALDSSLCSKRARCLLMGHLSWSHTCGLRNQGLLKYLQPQHPCWPLAQLRTNLQTRSKSYHSPCRHPK